MFRALRAGIKALSLFLTDKSSMYLSNAFDKQNRLPMAGRLAIYKQSLPPYQTVKFSRIWEPIQWGDNWF